LENGKYAGFNKASVVEAAVKDAKRAYGFLRALDPEFAKWRISAARSKAKGPPDSQLMYGYDITYGEGRKRTLRSQVKRACARLHGVK
jgi:hypothetical protein